MQKINLKKISQKKIEALQQGLPPSENAKLFGMDISPLEASLVIIGVPWDATTSYGQGTSKTPEEIILPSHQLDLEDPTFGTPYHYGISLTDELKEIALLNEKAHTLIADIRSSQATASEQEKKLREVNKFSQVVNQKVYETSRLYLSQGKLVSVLGGDHAAPFGLMQALGETYKEYGIIHFDAHMDLRNAYEDFEFSHASIMFNALEKIPHIIKLVSVGIRDFSRSESLYAESQENRISIYKDATLFTRLAQGETFHQIVQELILSLPKHVYISFDIDGLDPSYCPGTGTPVPGGLSFNQASYFLEQLAMSDKKIIGFDLCEIAGSIESEWDFNVGARILYKLCGAILSNQSH